jgi:hypothetical protein
MVIEGFNVSVPGGNDGALDKMGVLSVDSVVERAINVINEAARVVVQLVGSMNGGMTTCPGGKGGGGDVGCGMWRGEEAEEGETVPHR